MQSPHSFCHKDTLLRCFDPPSASSSIAWTKLHTEEFDPENILKSDWITWSKELNLLSANELHCIIICLFQPFAGCWKEPNTFHPKNVPKIKTRACWATRRRGKKMGTPPIPLISPHFWQLHSNLASVHTEKGLDGRKSPETVFAPFAYMSAMQIPCYRELYGILGIWKHSGLSWDPEQQNLVGYVCDRRLIEGTLEVIHCRREN